MKVGGAHILRDAQGRHAGAAKRLSAWLAEVRSPATVWTCFADIRARYPATDKVGEWYIFDVGGNRYRLITSINFGAGVVRIRWFGTHAEYNKINVREI